MCGSQPEIRSYLFTAASSSPLTLTPVECTGPPDMCVSRFLAQRTVMLRVHASLPLYVTTVKNRKHYYIMRGGAWYYFVVIVVVEKSISSLLRRIKSPACQFLLSSEHVLFNETSKDTLRTLLPGRCKAAAKPQHLSERHMAHTLNRPLLVELLESTESPQRTSLPVASTLRFGEPLGDGCVRISLPVDVLGLVSWDTTTAHVAALLKDSICAQLQAIKDEMLWNVCGRIGGRRGGEKEKRGGE